MPTKMTVKLSIEVEGTEALSASTSLDTFTRLSALGKVRTLGQMWDKMATTIEGGSPAEGETETTTFEAEAKYATLITRPRRRWHHGLAMIYIFFIACYMAALFMVCDWLDHINGGNDSYD